MFSRISETRNSSVLSLLLIFVMVVFLPWETRTYAQVVGATLSGTVTDASGAIVPNAHVSVRNPATGVTREVTVDAAGFYAAPNLLPGNYEVRFSAPGFTTGVNSGVTLTVGAQQVLNAILRVGQISQQVTVTTEAPTVELASSALNAVVEAPTIVGLPLNGRSWTDLASLQPGVAGVETQVAFGDSGRGNRGFGSQIIISGARPTQNNYRLDGISINDYSNGGPGSVLGGNLGVDAVEEFSVLTSNFSAEYGKTSGGVVNAITRSGTNQFHGSAYEFLRNSALDARNFFDGGTVPPFRQNQFGASAGGPIRKDRTFVFGDYEGVRRSLGTTVKNTTLSDNARLGILHDKNGNLLSPLVGPCPSAPGQTMTNLAPGQAAVCVDDKVAKYLPMFRPANSGTSTGDKGFY